MKSKFVYVVKALTSLKLLKKLKFIYITIEKINLNIL